MRGYPQAIGSRLVFRITRQSWLPSVRRGARRTKQEELELIERLERLEREARRSGPYVPSVGPQGRWS
jgi:hypothetical protein